MQQALCAGASRKPKTPGGGEGDEVTLELNDEVFSLFSELVYRQSGIKLGASKKGLVASRLAKRLIKSGAGSFKDYYRLVKSDSGELVEMLNCISTNTTSFFREPHHFEYLRDSILPDLLISRSQERMIRMWSAGCSTGEEPYSMAISVNEALRMNSVETGAWDIKILATDISTRVLEAAAAGIYGYEQLPANVPKDMFRRYFLKGINENAGTLKVKALAGNMVRFRRLNLMDGQYPLSKQFDVIFCRNVMIYFDDHMKRHVLSMFDRHLCSRGHLFLGHSETMLGNGQFDAVHITIYRKK